MTNFKAKIASATAIATIFGSSIASVAFADTTVVVSGNGNGSTNNVTVNDTENTTINQTNNSTIVNTVNTVASTGGNQANSNTNGTVNITTGDVNTTANISVTGSSNEANLSDCGCPDSNTTVKVKNNGNGSTNKVTINNSKKLTVKQKNYSVIVNTIKTKVKTGWNQANGNTGGSVDLTTGNVDTNADVSVTGSSNVLN